LSVGDKNLSERLTLALQPTLPALAEQTIAAIGREVPGYERPMEGPFGRGVRMGVERALARFLQGQEDDAELRGVYVELGRAEQRAGRSLDALLAAYRLGARLAWERFSAAGREAGVSPDELFDLAGRIFTYIDRISAESAEGWTAEAAQAEAERGRRRRALVRLLSRDDVAPDEVRDLAVLAGWPRPVQVAAVVAEGEDAGRLASRLGAGVLGAAEGGLSVLFVGDPEAPGTPAQLRAGLEDRRAAIGPAVALERSAVSLARARALLALLREGRVPGPVAHADDHLVDLLVHGDALLAADLAERVLAPLAGLPAGSRARLTETLRAWLDEPGQVTRVAARLHVHPQTVRYRVARLRELLGEALDDPDRRFALALALRASPGV
jgi:hypothetical protein